MIPFSTSLSPARRACALAGLLALLLITPSHAQQNTDSDVLVLGNGDTLHGKLLNVVSGKITFHNDSLGDLTVDWSKVRGLHAPERFAVLTKNAKPHGKGPIPSGAIDAAGDAITVHAPDSAAQQTIPVKQAEYVMDYATLDRQMNHEPGIFTGWAGAATAGATLVQATQNQYTVSGGLALARVVPAVTWLSPRNRTAADFSGTFGKITQPGVTPTKSAIFHVDAERDQYFTSHLFALAQLAFDHNYAQNLDLQQIYGAGLGWTLFSTPHHEADLKGTLQYEKQQFISGGPGSRNNLIGSTFAANYMRHMKLFTYAQSLEFIPSYNTPRAYSALEVDSFVFPAYKNLSFSVGTTDSYLNDPPASVPPTKRNSFQFTMGLSYAIKSSYSH